MRSLLFKILQYFNLEPLFSKSWDDIVFASRNKKYGAYELRRIYAGNQLLGLSITLGVSVLVILGTNNQEEIEPPKFEFEKYIEYKGFDANLLEVKPLIKEIAPPPTATEESPKQTPKDNLPPEVTREAKPQETATASKVDSVKEESERVGADSGKYKAGADSGIVEHTYEEGPAGPYGGLAEFMRWVQQNLVIPEEAIENKVHGTVIVHFVIDTTGSITKVTLSKGLGYGCDQAVMEVVKKAPKWKPAVRDGKAIPQRFLIPVKI